MSGIGAEFRTETFEPDNLIAGTKPPAKAIPGTLANGENVVRGELLGREDATGTWLASLAAATDGSEVVKGIAVEAVDASGGATKTLIYVEGEFNEDLVTIGAGHTLAAVKAAMADESLYLVTPVTKTPA